MDVNELLSQAKDAITVKRVFGEPFERDGVTIVPVAAVRGGAGGGSGQDANGDGSGSGSGFGVSGRPVGIYLIDKNGQVSWQPAFDLNRVILGGQLVGVAFLFVLRGIAKARAKTKRTNLRTRRLGWGS
jgi:uncharacterized spore protein YtfJ